MAHWKMWHHTHAHTCTQIPNHILVYIHKNLNHSKALHPICKIQVHSMPFACFSSIKQGSSLSNANTSISVSKFICINNFNSANLSFGGVNDPELLSMTRAWLQLPPLPFVEPKQNSPAKMTHLMAPVWRAYLDKSLQQGVWRWQRSEGASPTVWCRCSVVRTWSPCTFNWHQYWHWHLHPTHGIWSTCWTNCAFLK